jgi:mono/diheme cytochrome c family protein
MMKKMKIIVGSSLIFLAACTSNETANNDVDSLTDSSDLNRVEMTSNNYDGFQLMVSSCFSCHSPNPTIENPVAPTLAEMKMVYSDHWENQADFEQAIITFLENPTAENALISSAIEEYGLMPQMSMGQEKSAAIAKYLFQNGVETENWYPQQFQAEQRRVKLMTEDLSDIDRGFEYAMGTKSILGKNLKGKLKAEGPLGALSFCNLKAYHFTDSMSQVYDASIRRVSDQPRNQENTSSAMELEIIQAFKKQLAEGEEIKPETREFLEGYVHGYYPIVTNEMCMKCHGDVNQMEEGVHAKILALYPEDKATGYAPNQLRGIWVVAMKKRDQE